MRQATNGSAEGMWSSIVAGTGPIEFVAGKVPKASATIVSGLQGARKRGPGLSFVVPVKDEEATILTLYRGISAAVAALPDAHAYEVIFIDDGSRDASWSVVLSIAREQPAIVRGIRFRRNAGKAAALTAGFRAARGDVVFTMDGDLQDDPTEIPRFLAKLNEGFDVVSGWKRVRHDPWHKVWPSRIFNRMLSRFGGVQLHDHNCGFKCYRAEVVRGLTLYGELHRMVPCLSAMKGFRAGEIEIKHQPRLHGRSKYGIERFLRGFFDMLSVWFFRRFGERPSHLIGALGLGMCAIGALLILLTATTGVPNGWGLISLVLGAALIASSPSVLLLGLVAELLNRGGLEQQWQLRITEDTAVPPDAKSRAAASPLNPSYTPIVERYAYRPDPVPPRRSHS